MVDEPKYVLHGMRAKCNEGSMENYINTDKGHGVVYQGQPVLNANDHVKDINLTHFGDCKSKLIFEEAKKQADEKYKAEEGDGFFSKLGRGIAKTVTKVTISVKEIFASNKCELDTPLPWIFTSRDHMIDGAPALTVESQCACKFGGIITIVPQEVEAADESSSEMVEVNANVVPLAATVGKPSTDSLMAKGFVAAVAPIEAVAKEEKKKKEKKGAGNTGITEAELRSQLNSLVKKHLNFIEENKNVGFNTTDEAIDIVLKHDGTITEVSSTFGIPKEMIQAILFKEIRMIDARDVVADSFVMEYYRFNEAVGNYSKLNWSQQLIVGPPTVNSPMREDSSTGLGQIFASTAIEAHNTAIRRGDISGQYINYANISERKEIWYGLRDDETNIFYAGAVLRHKAELLSIDISNATGSQIEQTLARYNGFGNAAKEYGIETKQYYDLFSQYNK